MSIPMGEQETTVSAGRSDGYVTIWTSNSVHLKKLRADERVAEISGNGEYAQFRVPAEAFDPLQGFKRQRRKMTEEEREAASARLAEARKSRGK